MRLPLLRLPALLACSTMLSCAHSPPPVSAPPEPLPAAYLLGCEMPSEPADASCDATAQALKSLYDQYGACAGRLWDLQDYLQRAPAAVKPEVKNEL